MFNSPLTIFINSNEDYAFLYLKKHIYTDHKCLLYWQVSPYGQPLRIPIVTGAP